MNLCNFLNVIPNQRFTVRDFSAKYYVDDSGNICRDDGYGVSASLFKKIIERGDSVVTVPKFTNGELATMRRFYDIGYSYIGRDRDNSLWEFMAKPNKEMEDGVFERFSTPEYDNMWQLPESLIGCDPGELVTIADYI